MKSLVVGIAGPTGIGKTEFAVRLAKKLNGELISCDSVQIFKYLNIGANKFEPAEGDPPQHLVNILEPTDDFSASDFLKTCIDCIRHVLSRNKVPILVGGTGFYFDWFINGIPSAPPVSESFIKETEDVIKLDSSWDSSLERLKSVDPSYADILLKNDYYRLVKAIAFYQQFGRPLSSFGRVPPPGLADSTLDWRCVYLTGNRESICRNIDIRCEQMIQQGLLQETKDLLLQGKLVKDSIAGRSIGYKESIDFLEAITNPDCNVEDEFHKFLNLFTAATRQYARKQETWFANKFDDQFVWIERTPDIGSLVEHVYSFCTAADPSPWIAASKRLKARLRSQDGKESRRKAMRLYHPTFSLFNDPINVNNILSTVNK